ncbi:hypothetical protein [Halorussus caseinilyticus]|uniref:Uncharacterized protein n=1 Tax=Halorussus caseinilyticus TaxID=3034025 RepID=A0ABD5WKI4_9EURY|nr:hypothetical protein [Halorussus sp. DT72]
MATQNPSIELRYDSSFKQSITERERPDPLVGMKIKVGDLYVFGDENHVNSDYMTTNLTVQLEATEKILTNETVVVEYANGPMWLVIESEDENSIRITECPTIEGVNNPEQRLSIEKSAVVSKESWIRELIETAEEFYRKVTDLNPDLEDDSMLRRLHEEIEGAKRRLKEIEIS